MTDAAEVQARIIHILRSEAQVDGDIQAGSDLLRDLQLDSMSLTVLMVGLEDHYRVRLDGEDAVGVATVADLAALVVRKSAEPQP
ncbi:MAG: acyl carrier protein [Deltaproteobacteria bacterium]|nr:acyl carrier protein [Deltaproteobacteria bacterium]